MDKQAGIQQLAQNSQFCNCKESATPIASVLTLKKGTLYIIFLSSCDSGVGLSVHSKPMATKPEKGLCIIHN